MGFLNGGARALFGELLGGTFLAARIRSAPDGQPEQTYDDRGTLRRTPREWRNCRVQVDRATERMIATEGYTAHDRAIIVLADTLEGDLDTDAEIEVLEGPYAGSVFRTAAPIDRDPGGVGWYCRGVQKREPAGG